MTTQTDTYTVTRYEVDNDRWGREYGELKLWVRVPADYVRDAFHNEKVWDVADAYVDTINRIERRQPGPFWNPNLGTEPEIRTKGGMIQGRVNGCAADEILVTLNIR